MEALKNVEKMLEKELKQYGSEHESGKQMSSKDPEKLAHLALAMVGTKLLCMLEEMSEDPEKGGKALGMGAGMLGKLLGSNSGGSGGMGGMGGSMPWQGMGMNMNYPHNSIGFDTSSHHIPPYGDTMNRNSGVPGRIPHGTYDNYGSYRMDQMEMDDSMSPESRRGRSSRTGRFVHRAEMDDNMTDHYEDGAEMRQGVSGTGTQNTQNTGVGPDSRRR